MKEYRITRTSTYDEKPCENAYAKVIPSWDKRTFKSPEEFDARAIKCKWFDGPWFDFGTEHGVNEDGIYRRRGEDETVWYIQAESVEDLCREYGSLIVGYFSDPLGNEYCLVEIYDIYRE